MLAEPADPVVHDLGEFTQVTVQVVGPVAGTRRDHGPRPLVDSVQRTSQADTTTGSSPPAGPPALAAVTYNALGTGGTKLGRSIPRSVSFASQTLSSVSSPN